jgi:hypothetical protein
MISANSSAAAPAWEALWPLATVASPPKTARLASRFSIAGGNALTLSIISNAAYPWMPLIVFAMPDRRKKLLRSWI